MTRAALHIPAVATALLLALPSRSAAQNFRVVDEQVGARGHGYTVLHVWGTHEEMGYALGYAMADELADAMDQVREYLGPLYPSARSAVETLAWPEPALEVEMDAFVEGVRAGSPEADIDGTDVRVINALSDLPYLMCRSHSAWGRFVEPPVRTLSTRRFDYGAVVDFMYRHLIVAMDPVGGPQWVNVGWGSLLAVVTAVNEYGTVVALHDLGGAELSLGAPVPRSAAARAILTGVGGLDPESHTTWAAERIGAMEVMTDTFITYYVPEGLGGVFTCRHQVCELVRPQPDFLFGEAVITTNAESDGHSVPAGGEWLEEYYEEGGPKDLESHWEITGSSFHRLSVEFRGRGDMTLWFDGSAGPATTPRVELEWSQLFEPQAADGDSDADADAPRDSDPDGTAPADRDTEADAPGQPEGDDGSVAAAARAGGGCGCSAGRAFGPAASRTAALLVR
jgi:hypothetical protein